MNVVGGLNSASSFADVFEVVKKVVKNYLGKDQAGLLVGVSDLGNYGHAFLGAFYSMDANTIVINKRPLQSIQTQKPELYNAYLFHVLLHEYLHSIGIFDEEEVRMLSYDITKTYFGQNHPATQMALDIEQFIPDLTLGHEELELPEDMSIEFVHGIDRENTNYIL